MPHASLSIKVMNHIVRADGADGSIMIEMEGCEESIEKALTFLMVNNEKFKKMFNRSVRAANELRQAKQN